MPFNFIPASQIQQQKKKPAKPKATISKTSATSKLRRTIVTLPAATGKLFEPVMAREKPIIVEFAPDFSPDGGRFSKDGFFCIKYIAKDRRCYLIYFLNPVQVHKELTIEQACKEAIDYKIFEYEDSDDYRNASLTIDHERVRKLRYESALGQVELKIIEILREQIVAEIFLKKQRLIEKQNKFWTDFLADKRKQEEEQEKENEQQSSTGDVQDSGISGNNSEKVGENKEIKEAEQVQKEVREEKKSKGFLFAEKSEVGGSSSVKTGSGRIIWGGKK